MRISDCRSDVCSSDLPSRARTGISRLRARAEVAASLPGPQPQEQPGADGKVFFLLGPFHTQPRCYERKEVVLQLPSLLSESSGHDAGTRTTHPDGPITTGCLWDRSEERRVGKECVDN